MINRLLAADLPLPREIRVVDDGSFCGCGSWPDMRPLAVATFVGGMGAVGGGWGTLAADPPTIPGAVVPICPAGPSRTMAPRGALDRHTAAEIAAQVRSYRIDDRDKYPTGVQVPTEYVR